MLNLGGRFASRTGYGKFGAGRDMGRIRTHYIYELRQKLDGMEQNHRKLIENTSIRESRLKANLLEDRWRMNVEDQRELGRKFNFNIDWPEWRDPHASQNASGQTTRATAVKFLDRWREHNKRSTELTLEALATKCLHSRFASVRIDRLRASQLIPLSGDPFILCDEGDHEPRDVGAGFKVGLAGYELDFQLSSTGGGKLIDQGKQERAGNVVVEPRGTADKRWFLYSTASPPMRGHWEDSKPLVHYEGARHGDEIHVATKAGLEDCFVEFTGQPLEEGNRRKLAEFLARKEGLGQLDAEGNAVLVRQTLRIKEKS